MTAMVHKASSQYTAASALTVNTTQTVNQTNDSVDRDNFRLCCIIVPPSDFFSCKCFVAPQNLLTANFQETAGQLNNHLITELGYIKINYN